MIKNTNGAKKSPFSETFETALSNVTSSLALAFATMDEIRAQYVAEPLPPETMERLAVHFGVLSQNYVMVNRTLPANDKVRAFYRMQVSLAIEAPEQFLALAMSD